MPIYAIEDMIPVVDATAYVHPTAVVIGDVIIGPNCYIGPCASLRGDFGRITVEAGSNIQDSCILHSFPGTDCLVEEAGHIGHGAVLHGCRIGRNALVGMNAVVMDNAQIGPESLIGASAFVKTGFACEARSLVVGNPAKVLRELTQEELTWKSQGTREYQELAGRCLETLREVEPLRTVEKDRPRFHHSSYKIKQES